MSNKLSTKKFAEHFCSKVVSDYLDKKYTSDYFIDFKISKYELPNDFNKDKFLKIFKDNFNIIRIELIDLNYCIHVFGKVKCETFTREDFIKDILKDLAPTVQEASLSFEKLGKLLREAQEKGLLQVIS